jgi:hypothetical protein
MTHSVARIQIGTVRNQRRYVRWRRHKARGLLKHVAVIDTRTGAQQHVPQLRTPLAAAIVNGRVRPWRARTIALTSNAPREISAATDAMSPDSNNAITGSFC